MVVTLQLNLIQSMNELLKNSILLIFVKQNYIKVLKIYNNKIIQGGFEWIYTITHMIL